MRDLKQSTPEPVRLFLTLASDHVTGATGKALTVTLAKPGAGFAAAAGAVTERGHGWYDYTPTAGEVDTLGELAIHATAADCDPADRAVLVVTATAADAYAGTAAAIAALATTDLLVVNGWSSCTAASYTGELLAGAEIRILIGNFYAIAGSPTPQLDTLSPSAHTLSLGTLTAAGYIGDPVVMDETRDALIVTVVPGLTGSTTAGTLTLLIAWDAAGNQVNLTVDLPACAAGYTYPCVVAGDGSLRALGATRWGAARLATPQAAADAAIGVRLNGESYLASATDAQTARDAAQGAQLQALSAHLLGVRDWVPAGFALAYSAGLPPGAQIQLDAVKLENSGRYLAFAESIPLATLTPGPAGGTLTVDPGWVGSVRGAGVRVTTVLGEGEVLPPGRLSFTVTTGYGPQTFAADLPGALPNNKDMLLTADGGIVTESQHWSRGDQRGAAAVWAHLIEAGYSAEELMRLAISILCGLVAGSGTNTLSFRDIANTKARVTLTVDGQGNRTGVVLDAS